MIIIPFATIMGLYLHCGYESAPRWWYKTGITSWFITPMFHDSHHRFFRCSYGGFTTMRDRVFGTVRPTFEQDFDRLRASSAGLQAELKAG
jgi:sterol desaturase/sphingolipid hydroxylase (fatty acid hydroxylase superfamily)